MLLLYWASVEVAFRGVGNQRADGTQPDPVVM